jgi:hypothetical protein
LPPLRRLTVRLFPFGWTWAVLAGTQAVVK